MNKHLFLGDEAIAQGAVVQLQERGVMHIPALLLPK